jgi:hypothetical protein
VNMFLHYFYLDDLKSIVLTYLPDQSFCSFPYPPLEYILPIFWTSNHMITGVVDRMTHSFDRHSLYISYSRARAHGDKRNFWIPLVPPRIGMHSSPWQAMGHSAKEFRNKCHSHLKGFIINFLKKFYFFQEE